MKIISKKKETIMRQEMYQVGVINGFYAGTEVALLSFGAVMIVAEMTKILKDTAMVKSLYRYSTSNQNLESTVAYWTDAMKTILKHPDKKGLRRLIKLMYATSKKGFKGMNSDINRLAAVLMFDELHEYTAEIKNAVYELSGPGAVEWLKAWDAYEKDGVMQFPFGPAEEWSGILAREYKFTANIVLANSIAGKLQMGAANNDDFDLIRKVVKEIESELNSDLKDMSEFDTDTYDYWNARHFYDVAVKMIVESEDTYLDVSFEKDAAHITFPEFTDQKFTPGFPAKKGGKKKGGERTVNPPKKSYKKSDPEPEVWNDIDGELNNDEFKEVPEDGKVTIDQIKNTVLSIRKMEDDDEKNKAVNNLHLLITAYVTQESMTMNEFFTKYPTVKEVY